jgi:hypothetical protein
MQSRVQAFLVVDVLQELPDAKAGIFQIQVVTAIDLFVSQGLHERLAGGVIVGMAAPRHANHNAVGLQRSHIVQVGVLHATVGMVD